MNSELSWKEPNVNLPTPVSTEILGSFWPCHLESTLSLVFSISFLNFTPAFTWYHRRSRDPRNRLVSTDSYIHSLLMFCPFLFFALVWPLQGLISIAPWIDPSNLYFFLFSTHSFPEMVLMFFNVLFSFCFVRDPFSSQNCCRIVHLFLKAQTNCHNIFQLILFYIVFLHPTH